jgi:hypothetical protein
MITESGTRAEKKKSSIFIAISAGHFIRNETESRHVVSSILARSWDSFEIQNACPHISRLDPQKKTQI